jgi:hypothetical protein
LFPDVGFDRNNEPPTLFSGFNYCADGFGNGVFTQPGPITGSLKLGKSADMIVLEQNLFAIEPNEIANTKVEMTLFAGEIVYQGQAIR